MMSNLIELPNGTTIEKGTDGTWHIKSWVTGEVRDKDGQIIEVDELLKDVPNMMNDGGRVHLGHSDTPLGPITDVRKMMRDYKGKEIKAIQASWDIADDRQFKKWVQKGLEKGTYPELSIKAYAFEKGEFKDDVDGVLTEYPKGLEWVGFALCKKGKNPTTSHIEINGKVIEKSDDGKLTKEPNFKAVVSMMIKDGLSYKQSMEVAKEVYTDEIAKECADGRDGNPKTEKERKATHKEKYGDEDTPPRGTGKNNETYVSKGDIEMSKELEAMEKELAKLKKASEESTASLEKSVEDLKTELAKEQEISKGLKEELEKENGEHKEVAKEDVPVAITKEDVAELMKVQKLDILAELVKEGEPRDALLKSMGLVKAGETPKGLSTLLKGTPDEEALDTLDKMLAESNLRKASKELENIPDYEEVLKAEIGEPKKEGE